MDMSGVIESISNNVPVPEEEYTGEDGFLYCSKCNTRVQTDIEVF